MSQSSSIFKVQNPFSSRKTQEVVTHTVASQPFPPNPLLHVRQ